MELAEKVERIKINQQVLERFKTALANGELHIGEKLPSERQLAKSMQVSRTSLREVISILSAYGVLESRHGEGTFVTDRFVENVLDFLGFDSIPLRQKFKYLIDLRISLEIGSIDISINKVSNERRRELNDILISFEKVTDIDELISLDASLHKKIISYTDNPIYVEMYKMSSKMLRSLISYLMPIPGVYDKVLLDHKKIVEFYCSGDIEKCKEVVRDHLNNIKSYVDQYIQ